MTTPTYAETLQITTDILKTHVELDRPIRPNDHIQNDLGLDSLGVMEVVADIEDHFKVTIPALTGMRSSPSRAGDGAGTGADCPAN